MSKDFIARHAIGKAVQGTALVASDGFSARYDLDRIAGVFSRPAHKLAGQSYVGRILVLDTAKGGVASAWMLHEMASRAKVPLAIVFNTVNPILVQADPGPHAPYCTLEGRNDVPETLDAQMIADAAPLFRDGE